MDDIPKMKTQLYIAWRNMKVRCKNKNRRDYKWYGGRGIKVCIEWLDFAAFQEWALKNGYWERLALEIDRIDCNGDYCPENCRWVRPEEQNRNRSDNTMITLHGITRCLEEWCTVFKISHSAVYQRLKRGWDIERAITEKVGKYTKKI
jgi:hypothetical protein